MLSRNESAKGALISAKPEKIAARNKKIRLSIFPPPSYVIVKLYVIHVTYMSIVLKIKFRVPSNGSLLSSLVQFSIFIKFKFNIKLHEL